MAKVQLNIKITEEMDEALKKIAQEDMLSKTSTVRNALSDYIKNRNRKKS